MYLSFVMILSESSSISFSAAQISFSIWVFTCSDIPSCSMTFSSLSNIFIAYHLCCSSATSLRNASSIWAIACSTTPLNECWGTIGTFDSAAFTASSAASLIPVPLSADISQTWQPSSLASWSVFILSPFFLTTSIMLIATTTGIPSSTSCVVR